MAKTNQPTETRYDAPVSGADTFAGLTPAERQALAAALNAWAPSRIRMRFSQTVNAG
jgi:hypothetical protein